MNSGWVRFETFRLDLDTGDLLGAAGPVDLQPLPARVLALLAANPGRIVTREEIKQHIWAQSTFAVDQALNTCIRQVRLALGDSAAEPRIVATVPRRGYRFVAAVGPIAGPPAPAEHGRNAPVTDSRSSSPLGRRRPSPTVLALVAVLSVAVAFGIEQLPGSRSDTDGDAGIHTAATLPPALRVEYLKARELLAGSDTAAWRAAAASFDAVRQREPEFLLATAGAGHAALRLGEYERAAGLAAWTLAADSLNGEAHMILGLSLLQRDDRDAARAALDRARSLAPELVPTYTGLAVLAALDGSLDAAYSLAEASVDADPISAITLGDAGYVALWAGRPERAIEWCGHAVDLLPDWPTPRYCLLDANHVLDRPEAERDQAVEIMRRLAEPALVREVADPPAAAGLRRYRAWQVRRLDPDGREPPERAIPLAFLRMQDGDEEAARRLLEIAAEIHPERLPTALLDPVFEPLREDILRERPGEAP
jgi:DNA-binding winged helix-turn-helix (wHTH) protein/tetratricopeptide (TPR) repeat protein